MTKIMIIKQNKIKDIIIMMMMMMMMMITT